MRRVAGDLSFRVQLAVLGWVGRLLRQSSHPFRAAAARIAAWILLSRRDTTARLLERFERRTAEIRETAALLRLANSDDRLN